MLVQKSHRQNRAACRSNSALIGCGVITATARGEYGEGSAGRPGRDRCGGVGMAGSMAPEIARRPRHAVTPNPPSFNWRPTRATDIVDPRTAMWCTRCATSPCGVHHSFGSAGPQVKTRRAFAMLAPGARNHRRHTRRQKIELHGF